MRREGALNLELSESLLQAKKDDDSVDKEGDSARGEALINGEEAWVSISLSATVATADASEPGSGLSDSVRCPPVPAAGGATAHPPP